MVSKIVSLVDYSIENLGLFKIFYKFSQEKTRLGLV